MASLALLVILACLTISPTDIAAHYTSIYIRENGTNSTDNLEDCLGNSCVCSNLGSVLNSLSKLVGTVNISVEYNHSIASVEVLFTSDMVVSILGKENSVVFCNKGATVTIESNANVSFSFQGVNWQGCGMHTQSGFNFSGLYSLSLIECVVMNSSDIAVMNTNHVIIQGCQFLDMDYINAALHICFADTRTQGPPKTIRHLIQTSNFSRTTTNQSTSLGILGIMLNIHNNSTTINTVIDGCIFQENLASHGVAIFAQNSGEMNNSVLMINGCEFSQQQAGMEDIVKIILNDFNISRFSFLLNGSYFHDNIVNGSIVNVTMSRVVSSETPLFVYSGNNFTSNTGFGLNIETSAVRANHSIRESTFNRNKGIAINVWCNNCERLEANLELVNVSVEHNLPNTLQYDNVPVTLFGITLTLQDSLFANNVGTALMLTDLEATYICRSSCL